MGNYQLEKMNIYIYNSKKLMYSLFIIPLFIYLVIESAVTGDIMFSSFFFFTMLFYIFMVVGLKSIKIIIDENGIQRKNAPLQKNVKYTWGEIEAIVDDYLGTKGTRFTRLIIKSLNKTKKRKAIVLPCNIKNHKDLIHEIVHRVPKNTKIDPSIFDYIGEKKILNNR